MSAKDCHVKNAILFFTTFPLAVFFVDVVLYAVSLFFVFFISSMGF
jgi:hypothetical protein